LADAPPLPLRPQPSITTGTLLDVRIPVGAADRAPVTAPA